MSEGKKLLPLGSVVLLEEGLQKLVIVGRGAIYTDQQTEKDTFGMATLFLTKIIRCCECCGVMAPIALDNEHPRI